MYFVHFQITALSNLVSCLTSFERILRTPIPLAYSVHLHHMTWLYLVALPYQIMEECGWWTLPVVGIATFSFIGILEIGWEIENPFGYDANDLVKVKG
jgi:putative membrane protein